MRTRTSLATLGLLALTACGGGGAEAEPEPILPSSSAPSPEPSASTTEDAPEAPVMPEAAKERTAEGARKFVEYWGALITYAQNSGDTAGLAGVSGSECESCNGVIELIDEVYDDGGSMRSNGWQARQVVFGTDPSRPLAIFQRGLETTTRAGEEPERYPAAEVTIDFTLDWSSSQWSVDEFAQRAD